jgi:DNA-binding NarL/FixJ family response regulator
LFGDSVIFNEVGLAELSISRLNRTCFMNDVVARLGTECMAISDRIRVLCVDDHPLVRDGIAFALQQHSDMELVAEANNGIDAVAAFRQYRPDVTLMDLRMPQMNGIEATTAIRDEFPNARIVILTTYSGDIQASRAIKVGAMGYLLKGMLRTELIHTIRRVHSGQRHIPVQIATEIAEHFVADALSEREIEVLRCVATGCSNKVIADKLFITEDTVKGHMKNILAKLQANDRTHAVMIAIKRGFLDD